MHPEAERGLPTFPQNVFSQLMQLIAAKPSPPYLLYGWTNLFLFYLWKHFRLFYASYIIYVYQG